MFFLKVGVTGAGGYIGLRLVQRLRELNHEVVACDHGFMQGPRKTSDVQIKDADIRDLDSMNSLFKDVDSIIHLASISGLVACDKDRKKAFETNVIGTQNLAFVCRENDIPLIFASSMAALGEIKEFPIKPSNEKKPINFYGFTKYSAGRAIEFISEDYFPSIIFLKSNVYGGYFVGEKKILKPTVVNLFAARAIGKKDLVVNSPGTQARNFVHIEDAIQAYVQAAEKIRKLPKKATYLTLASNDYNSINDIAKKVQEVSEQKTNFRPEIKQVENPRNNEVFMNRFDVDLTETKKAIGYEPSYSLEKGIEQIFCLGV